MYNEVGSLDTIVVTDIEEKSGYYGISNMIVHENYMIEGLSDMHDVGEFRGFGRMFLPQLSSRPSG